MDIEDKLDLVQQIRREQTENERYFYNNLKGRKYDSYEYGNYGRYYSGEEEQQGTWFASFRLRLLFAMLLFLCFFVMEKKEIAVEGIGCAEIVEYISSNMNIENFSALKEK